MDFRSSTSATASVCAKETNALTASKTVASNAGCAISFVLRWADSDARRSIKRSVHGKEVYAARLRRRAC
jgi:hypothetical protein